MKIVRKLMMLGVLPALALLVVCGMLMSSVPQVYDMVLYYPGDTVFLRTDDPDQVVMIIKGANLLRANSIYLDGEYQPQYPVEKSTYEQCFVTFDKDVLGEIGTWHEIQVAFVKLGGLVNVKGDSIWVEWKGI